MERAIPILPAEDLAVAKTFYVNGLGFRVVFEVSEDGRRGLLGVERGTITLTLDSPMDGHGRNACVSLDDDWGARTFDLLDPFGNTIFVMGPVSTTPSRDE